MAPFLIPVAASIAGAAVTGLMNKSAKPAALPKVTPPPVGDQDTTPGMTSNPALGNAASQSLLSSNNSNSNKLLGG